MLIQLHKKLVGVILLVSSLLLFILLSLIYQFTAANLKAESISIMQSVSFAIGSDSYRPDATYPQDRLHYFVLAKSIWGQLIVVGNTSFNLDDQELLTTLYHTAAQTPGNTGELRQYSLRFCRLMDARGEAYVFADISDELSTLRSLRRSCLIIGVATLLILLVISNRLVSYLIRPVDLAWQQQKQFVADASHELKTPLTVIMTNAELLRSSEYSHSQKEEFVDHISVMTQRMRALIEGMLDLARVDSGVVASAFQLLDYSELVEQGLLPFEPLFFESGRVLESQITPRILLTGSPTHLSQVTEILLDNALKYSYPDSTVRLSLQQQGKYALLCVDSPGQPIAPEDLEKIFRRFYTVDQTRTGSSYGLGLSIAQGIIREHKGETWAESAQGHNRFYVKLPLTPYNHPFG